MFHLQHFQAKKWICMLQGNSFSCRRLTRRRLSTPRYLRRSMRLRKCSLESVPLILARQPRCWHENDIPNQKGCKPNQNWHQNDWRMVAVIQHNSSMAIKSTTKTIGIPNKKTIMWRWTKEYLTVLVRFYWCFLDLFTIAGIGTNLLTSIQNAFSAPLIHFRGQLGFSAYNAFLVRTSHILVCISHIEINLIELIEYHTLKSLLLF